MTSTEILNKYTGGEITLDQANESLRARNSGFHLDPEKNVLTEEDKRSTFIGIYPDMATGFGLLDTGTGTMDKVKVEQGKLVNADCGAMEANLYIAGRMYHVVGKNLTE